jgi:hypothetical protein
MRLLGLRNRKYVTYILTVPADMLHNAPGDDPRALTGEIQMMPVVRLSDATFEELKAISTWLGTSTPPETIERLVREKSDALGLERDANAEPEVPAGHEITHFEKAPGLSFTRLIHAKIDGTPITTAKWVRLLIEMIAAVKAKGLAGDKLVAELQVPAKARSFSDDGFRYYPDLGISVQGQSAQDIWKEVERLAKKWKIPVEAQFQWRQNDKAQHPGRSGLLRAGGT